MNPHKLTTRIANCYRWQYRWGVFVNQLGDLINLIPGCIAAASAGIFCAVVLVLLPIITPLKLLWSFTVSPFLIAFRLSNDMSSELAKRVSTAPDKP